METKLDIEDDELQFKTYTSPPVLPTEGTIGTIEVPEKNTDESFGDSKSNEGEHKGGRSWLGFLSIEYYQEYFDVTTSDVFRRVVAGMLPFPFKLSNTIASSPDLYGPFWLCMTLIFTTALSGNLAALLSGNSTWEFHFHEVIVIATVIYCYTWLLPVFLWIFLTWRNTSDRYTLVQLQAVYGYSMAIFIPLTLLWMLNIELVRWVVLVVAVILSGSVLVQALWKPLQNETTRVAIILLVIVFLLHAGIAIGFKFYYFGSALAPDVSSTITASSDVFTKANTNPTTKAVSDVFTSTNTNPTTNAVHVNTAFVPI